MPTPWTASNRNAIVLNNRGFSRVLQNRLDDGIADLVAALEKKPDLAAARTNLRLAMGLKGDYDRALAAGPQEDKAALLNNVGYAALLRGDHKQAQELFNKAHRRTRSVLRPRLQQPGNGGRPAATARRARQRA